MARREALATLRQVPWDVLVLDMFLREGTGLGGAGPVARRTGGPQGVRADELRHCRFARGLRAPGADAVFDKSTELDEFFAAFLA